MAGTRVNSADHRGIMSGLDWTAGGDASARYGAAHNEGGSRLVAVAA